MRRPWIAFLAILCFVSTSLLLPSPITASVETYFIATASPGGTYYAYGGGWSNLLNQELGMNTSTQVTGGSVDNVILMGNKKVDFAMAASATVLDGYRGSAKWTGGKKFVDMRVLFMTHLSALHVLSKASKPIHSIKEIDGKRISLGPAGSVHDTIFRLINEIFAVKPTRIVNLPFGDGIRQLSDNRIDLIGMTVGIPNGSVTRFDVSQGAHLTSLTSSEKEAILKKAPYLVPYTIPANTYKSINKPIDTVAVWSMIITDKDKPADVIYRILKATYANKELLVSAHKAANCLDEKTVLGSPIPLHAGAVRFYRDRGLQIPARLVPPEFK